MFVFIEAKLYWHIKILHTYVLFSSQQVKFPRKETAKVENNFAKDEDSIQVSSNVETETPCERSKNSKSCNQSLPDDGADQFVVRVKRSNTIPLSPGSRIRL